MAAFYLRGKDRQLYVRERNEGHEEFAVAASLLATSALSSRRHDVKA
jgi:hypothetical protein